MGTEPTSYRIYTRTIVPCAAIVINYIFSYTIHKSYYNKHFSLFVSQFTALIYIFPSILSSQIHRLDYGNVISITKFYTFTNSRWRVFIALYILYTFTQNVTL